MAHGPAPVLAGQPESLAFGAANFLELGEHDGRRPDPLGHHSGRGAVCGLARLRLPVSHGLCLCLALRWVPEIFATVNRVKEAQEARGLVWSGAVSWSGCGATCPCWCLSFS